MKFWVILFVQNNILWGQDIEISTPFYNSNYSYLFLGFVIGLVTGGIIATLVIMSQYKRYFQPTNTEKRKQLEECTLGILRCLNDLRETVLKTPEPFSENYMHIKNAAYLIQDMTVDLAVLVQSKEDYENLIDKARLLVSEVEKDLSKISYTKLVDDFSGSVHNLLIR